jgi:hypothetical protein
MDQTFGLVEPALSGMRALQAQFPNLQFISGKRDITDEAKDIVADGLKLNPDSPQTGTLQYVGKTYHDSKVKDSVIMALRGANDDTADVIAAIVGALNLYSPDDLKLFSLHLSGLAADAEPLPAQEAEITQFAQGLPGLKRFLTTEAGLPRWHFEWTQEGQPSAPAPAIADVTPTIPVLAPGQQGFEQFHTPDAPAPVVVAPPVTVPSIVQDTINTITPHVAAIVSAIAPKPVEPPHNYATAVDTHVALVQAAMAKKAAAIPAKPVATTAAQPPKKKDNTTLVLVGLGLAGVAIAMRGK